MFITDKYKEKTKEQNMNETDDWIQTETAEPASKEYYEKAIKVLRDGKLLYFPNENFAELYCKATGAVIVK